MAKHEAQDSCPVKRQHPQLHDLLPQSAVKHKKHQVAVCNALQTDQGICSKKETLSTIKDCLAEACRSEGAGFAVSVAFLLSCFLFVPSSLPWLPYRWCTATACQQAACNQRWRCLALQSKHGNLCKRPQTVSNQHLKTIPPPESRLFHFSQRPFCIFCRRRQGDPQQLSLLDTCKPGRCQRAYRQCANGCSQNWSPLKSLAPF